MTIDDIPLTSTEQKLSKRLFNHDFTLDEGLTLYHSIVGNGRRFPPTWEIRVLELGLKAHPDRQDLRERLTLLTKDTLSSHQTISDSTTQANGQWALEIVSKAKSRMESALDLPNQSMPAHGKRWNSYALRIRSAIKMLSTPIEILHFAQTKIGFEHRGNIQHEGKFTAFYERELMSFFAHVAEHHTGFADITDSAPDTTYEHNGRLISNVLFYLERVILSCLTYLPSSPQVILEIGGGYGAPARLWMKNPISQPNCYLILDMPESLFFADVFLRKEFGDDAVFYVTSAPLPPDILEKYSFILCPLQLNAVLQDLPIDLIINTGSLQEMSEDWVDFYKNWMDNQRCRWFYSLNYFAQPIGALWESGNLWSPRLSPKWTARLLRWNPAFVRMQSERDFLEALYEKCDNPISQDEALTILRNLTRKAPCGEVFMELMDIVRLFPNPAFMFETLSFVMRMPVAPKEALWLAENLLNQQLSKKNLSIVEEWRRALAQKRASGTEAYY
jgi:putative sugar O-methyltransferase